jgi:transcriptional regulator with XRE-family HTH domain
MDDTEIGDRVKQARETAGVSARQVAKAAGMDPAAYSRSESGARGFRATEIVDIANRLDIPLDMLVQRASGDTIAAGRKAQVAGEEALGAVASWLVALDRALALTMPKEGLVAIPAEKRTELHTLLSNAVRTVLPRVQTVAATPGMRAVLDDALRIELPRLVQLVEVATQPPVEEQGR